MIQLKKKKTTELTVSKEWELSKEAFNFKEPPQFLRGECYCCPV